MKKLLVLFSFLAVAITANAQIDHEYWSTHKFPSETVPDSVARHPLYKAGYNLKASANLDVTALVFAGVGAGAFALGIDQKHPGGFNAVGIVCVSAAFIAKIASVVYKYKSGRELTLSPTRLTFKF